MKTVFDSLSRQATLLFALFFAPSIAMAQDFVRVGGEFQVNTYTPEDQYVPDVAMAGNGAFVVVWSDNEKDQGYTGVFARRFAADGLALATEFQVSAYTTDSQDRPTLAMTSGGSFVVAWELDRPGESDVFVRRFNAAGGALGVELQVDQFDSQQFEPDVAVDADGDFVVVWMSRYQDGLYSGVFARRFGSSGAALGPEFQVNDHTEGDQQHPAVAMGGNGAFVVVWEDFGFDGYDQAVVARRFDSSGTPLAVEFQVNSYTLSSQDRPAVQLEGDGDFVVAWESSGGQDGDGFGVFAQRFGSAGVRQGGELQVNVETESSQSEPDLAIGGGGDFLVTWSSFDQDGNNRGVFGRRFHESGLPLSTEFQVNTQTVDVQADVVVATSASGATVIAWRSQNQDGADNGVFAQRFDTLVAFDVDGNGSSDPLTDGLLVLRYMFGFRNGVLVNNAVGPGCRRCDSTAIEAYLAPRI